MLLVEIIAAGMVIAAVIGYSYYSGSVSLTSPKPANSGSNMTTIANITAPATFANVNSNNSSVSHRVLRIAFVKPYFTFAAYQNQSFYNFYHKYEHIPTGKNVTTDLHLLSTRKVPAGPFLPYNTDRGEDAKIPQQKYYDAIMKIVNQTAASLNQSFSIANISDKEVHDGKIFASGNASKNAYDILFLFHEEYATQTEYDNLEKFVVQDGGTIVFDDANILTTEVKYDNSTDSITLVRGHTWQYNGKSAWRVERERWANETEQWVGSNFLQDPTKDNVTFSNNPFNYTHSEEQFVTNPKDKIILDFGARETEPNETNDKQQVVGNETVAIYELESGRGKVIMIGIFAHKLADNKAFLDFYAKQIIPRVFGEEMPPNHTGQVMPKQKSLPALQP